MTSSQFEDFKSDINLRRFITVRGQYDHFHRYENAPDQVAFLRNLHRHLFKWTAVIEVFHDDRELEFFMVMQHINSKIMPFIQIKELGSCEMQAEDILRYLVDEYGAKRYYKVTVSEDGENDGTIEWDPSTLSNR